MAYTPYMVGSNDPEAGFLVTQDDCHNFVNLKCCPVCYDDKHNGVLLEKCSHYVCYDCLGEYLKTRIQRGHIPIFCPIAGCQKRMDQEVIKENIKRFPETEIKFQTYCNFLYG